MKRDVAVCAMAVAAALTTGQLVAGAANDGLLGIMVGMIALVVVVSLLMPVGKPNSGKRRKPRRIRMSKKFGIPKYDA